MKSIKKSFYSTWPHWEEEQRGPVTSLPFPRPSSRCWCDVQTAIESERRAQLRIKVWPWTASFSQGQTLLQVAWQVERTVWHLFLEMSSSQTCTRASAFPCPQAQHEASREFLIWGVHCFNSLKNTNVHLDYLHSSRKVARTKLGKLGQRQKGLQILNYLVSSPLEKIISTLI